MGQVLIRDLSDDVIATHRRRPKALGHLLEHELRTLIESTAPYSAAEKIAIAERSQSLTPAVPRTDAATLIREDLDW
jgi:hypothetical protein